MGRGRIGHPGPSGVGLLPLVYNSNPLVPLSPGSSGLVAPADPSGEAQVSWTVPPTDGDQPITSYTITPEDQTYNSTGPAQSVPASELSAVVTGLATGDTYTFAVSGVNLIGTGLPAVSNAVTIPAHALPRPRRRPVHDDDNADGHPHNVEPRPRPSVHDHD